VRTDDATLIFKRVIDALRPPDTNVTSAQQSPRARRRDVEQTFRPGGRRAITALYRAPAPQDGITQGAQYGPDRTPHSQHTGG